MFNVALAKSIISIAAGSSAGYVTRHIIANNTNPQTNFEIARVWLGSFTIGGAVANYIQKDTHQSLDQIEEICTKHMAKKNATE